MAANGEYEMKKCTKCYYYFPNDDLKFHLLKCKSSEQRLLCPICNCDYIAADLDKHIDNCKGLEDKISFVIEFSRKKYSKGSIRKLLNFLHNAYDLSLSGRDILRTINESQFNINHWISFEDEVFKECPICLSDVPLDDIFVLSCNDDHKICYDCLFQHSIMKLNENETLTCPIDDCKKVIHVNEIRSLPFPQYIVRKLTEKYDTQLFNNFVQNTKGTIRCPNASCNWAAILDVVGRYNIKCGKCDKEFCSICRSGSHFRIECNEIAKCMQQWMVWCNVGRNAHGQNKMRQQQAVNAYEKAYEGNKLRNEELKRNFEQLKQDEQYKVGKCKHCPGCNRIVEKLSGCDSMVCGKNYHGGDIQNGCGMRFNWQQAIPYKNQIQDQPTLEAFALQAPQQADKVNHYPYKCDCCLEDIIGVRFECINCECINFCENCEEQQTLAHVKNHLFRLVLKNDN